MSAHSERLYSVVDGDGLLVLHWRTSEQQAAHFAAMNHVDTAGNVLVGPTGSIVARFTNGGRS